MAELSNDLTRVADMLSDVVDEAMRQQDLSGKALQALNQESQRIESVRDSTEQALTTAMSNLPTRVEAAIDARLRDAADQAANTMLSRWTLANQAAERASRIYRLSVSRLIGLVVTVFSLGIVGGAALVTWAGLRAW